MDGSETLLALDEPLELLGQGGLSCGLPMRAMTQAISGSSRCPLGWTQRRCAEPVVLLLRITPRPPQKGTVAPPAGAVMAELEPDDELLLLKDDPLLFSDSDGDPLDEPELELLPALAAMSLCDQIPSAT